MFQWAIEMEHWLKWVNVSQGKVKRCDEIMIFLFARDHSFITFARFSEKLTFLTP